MRKESLNAHFQHFYKDVRMIDGESTETATTGRITTRAMCFVECIKREVEKNGLEERKSRHLVHRKSHVIMTKRVANHMNQIYVSLNEFFLLHLIVNLMKSIHWIMRKCHSNHSIFRPKRRSRRPQPSTCCGRKAVMNAILSLSMTETCHPDGRKAVTCLHGRLSVEVLTVHGPWTDSVGCL